MIRLLLMLLLAITPAQAKTKTAQTQIKTAQTRVADAFKTLRPYRPPPRKPVSVEQLLRELDAGPQLLSLRKPPQYIADRPAYYVNGKLMLYRECEVDVKQDPGESSCRVVWAWI